MQVVVVGAGEIGWYLAERLGAEGHDVVVVESDSHRAAAISGQLDVQVITGSGTRLSVLEAAGVREADLVAAVTQLDEVNLVACMLAKELSEGRPIETVIRIQDEELRTDRLLIERVGADLVIDPDADTADEIIELVHSTGADEVYPMANGELLVIGGTITDDAALANQNLADVARAFEPNWPFLFGAVTRDGVTTIPRGDQTLEVGDHVRVLTTKTARREILQLIGAPAVAARRVMILGGGAIGSRVASALQDEGAEVVLVERDAERAEHLAASTSKIIVVHGDITDTELLAAEKVGRMDAVIASTGEDSSNVLACAYAAAEGAAFTVAVLHRLALLPLVQRFGINAALSPRTASANAVLRHVRGGTTAVATFLESNVEVDEIEVEAGSRADGAKVMDLHLPRGVLLGATIAADGTAEIVRGQTELAAGDHLVVFTRPAALEAARGVFTA